MSRPHGQIDLRRSFPPARNGCDDHDAEDEEQEDDDQEIQNDGTRRSYEAAAVAVDEADDEEVRIALRLSTAAPCEQRDNNQVVRSRTGRP